MIELDLSSGSAAFEQTITLDDVPLRVGFTWNTRMAAWMMDLSTADGDPILLGTVVRVGIPLAAFPLVTGLGGVLFAADSEGKDADPGIEDLGARVRIYYATAEEILAV